MPIYLVRWPGLAASLVRAVDEDHVLDILDQVANPEGCECSEYDGPLHIDIEIPAKWKFQDRRPGEPVAPEQVLIEDVGPMSDKHVLDTLEVSFAEGDDGAETEEQILKEAFPVLHAAVAKFRSSDEAEELDGVMPQAELTKALCGELVRMLKASWRKAQVEKGTDAASQLARETDLPLRLAQQYVDAAEEHEPVEDSDLDPEGLEAMSSDDPADGTAPGRRLFTVSSHHTADGGEAPDFDGDKEGTYFGYFVNEYGDQVIYAYDHETGEATIRMGDTGWREVYWVFDGQVEASCSTRLNGRGSSPAGWPRAQRGSR